MGDDTENCYIIFSNHTLTTLLVTRGTVALVAVVACGITLVMIVMARALGHFTQRLTLYLTLSAFASQVTYLLQVVPVKALGHVPPRLQNLCVSAGVLETYLEWVQWMLISWIVLYLFIWAIFGLHWNKKKHEATGLALSLLFPFVFSLVPLSNKMYNHPGPWCRLAGFMNSCQDSRHYFQYEVAYDSLRIVLHMMNFALMTIMAAMFCTRSMPTTVHSEEYHSQHRRALREAAPLLVYPLLAMLVDFLTTASHLLYIHKKVKTGLWLVLAILAPLMTFSIPTIMVIQTQNCVSRIRVAVTWCCRRHRARGYQPVSPSSSQVITPSNTENSCEYERDFLTTATYSCSYSHTEYKKIESIQKSYKRYS